MRLSEELARLPRGQQIAAVVGVGMASMLVWCCGGLGTVGAIVGPVPSKSPKPPTAKVEVVASPSEHPEILVTESPSPSPSPSLSPSESPSPSPVPTTQAPPPPPVQTTTKAPPPPPPPAPPTEAPAPPPPAPGPAQGVHPGAFCSPQGAMGYTVDGTLMQCKPSPTDPRNRWRKA